MAALAGDGKALFHRAISSEAEECTDSPSVQPPSGSGRAPGKARKAPPPEEEEDEEEIQALVLDHGSRALKAGLAGDDAPRAVRQSLCRSQSVA